MSKGNAYLLKWWVVVTYVDDVDADSLSEFIFNKTNCFVIICYKKDERN